MDSVVTQPRPQFDERFDIGRRRPCHGNIPEDDRKVHACVPSALSKAILSGKRWTYVFSVLTRSFNSLK